jgi:superfamily I DNA and/or RNA helicase
LKKLFIKKISKKLFLYIIFQALANFMTYDGQLECANSSVAEHSLQFEDWPSWLPAKAATTSVAFFDTSNIGSTMQEAKDELGISNIGEADFVAKLALKATKAAKASSAVGVIAPYRAQVATLRRLLALFPASDISTVDQFQV